MAARTATKGVVQRRAKASKGKGFTDAEKGAMQQRIKELQAGAGETESEVLAKIATFDGSDRAMAERIHAIVKASAPGISPKLWYGMPAYYKDGKSICFFKDARKFKARYATLGFNDSAHLDDGTMWPVEFALMKLTSADEARISALVKKAVS